LKGVHCCSMNMECDHEIPLPPLPKMVANRPSTITGNSQRSTFTDFDGLSEKYWGEILERTFSSNSLHQHHQQQQQQHHHQHNHNAMLNSSSSSNNKHHYLTNNTAFSDINLHKSDTNLYYSNSEPRLCEHDLHDINCAKNRAFFGEFNKIDDM